MDSKYRNLYNTDLVVGNHIKLAPTLKAEAGRFLFWPRKTALAIGFVARYIPPKNRFERKWK